MKHTAAQIVEVARGAGVQHALLAPFAAVALVASGGNDHYDMRAGMPGAGHWQGLWALDRDRYPDLAGLDLHDPHVNAQAAWRLTCRERTLDWSPAYASGACRYFRDRATAAVGARPEAATEHVPVLSQALHRAGIVDDWQRKAESYG